MSEGLTPVAGLQEQEGSDNQEEREEEEAHTPRAAKQPKKGKRRVRRAEASSDESEMEEGQQTQAMAPEPADGGQTNAAKVGGGWTCGAWRSLGVY
jgi:hypothetical protein